MPTVQYENLGPDRFKIKPQELTSRTPEQINKLLMKFSLLAMSEADRQKSDLENLAKKQTAANPHNQTIEQLQDDLEQALNTLQSELEAEGFDIFQKPAPTKKAELKPLTPEQKRLREVGELTQKLMLTEPEFKIFYQKIIELFANTKSFLNTENVNTISATETLKLKKTIKEIDDLINKVIQKTDDLKQKLYGNQDLRLEKDEETEILKLLPNYVKLNNILPTTALRKQIIEKNLDLRDYLVRQPAAKLKGHSANRGLKNKLHTITELKEELQKLAA